MNGIIAELELQTSLKVGLGLQGEDLGRPMETDPSNYSYLSALGMMKQGPEYIEQLLTFWQEVEFISLDNFISFKDTNMASYFNKVIILCFYFCMPFPLLFFLESSRNCL